MDIFSLIIGAVVTGVGVYSKNEAENAAFKQMQTQQLIAASQSAKIAGIGRDVLIAAGIGLVVWSAFVVAFEK